LKLDEDKNEMKLKNKVAVIVGGAGGIGKSTSLLLAREGAKVMVADIDLVAAGEVVKEIKSSGFEASAIAVDMTKEEDTVAVAKATLNKYGQIDILGNVAGGAMGKNIREKMGPFAESTKEMWDRILDINLNGARNCTRAVINHMMERRSGKIVSMSSMAGVQGVRNGVDYSAAKAAIIGFTRALALEMAPYGIQVNCISPSGVFTPRMEAIAKAKKARDPNAQTADLSGFIMPDEIANLILFLVSDDISHLSGENIIVNSLKT